MLKTNYKIRIKVLKREKKYVPKDDKEVIDKYEMMINDFKVFIELDLLR